MPQIDENQASPTITVLLKRVLAGAIDLTLIAIPTMVVAFAASEQFSILEMRNGRARFELADQLRINEIDSGLNRATQIGDTVYALSGAGLILTIATVMMMTLLVFVLMPALQNGQTPGRGILRLPTRGNRQDQVERVAVSIIDASDQVATEPTPHIDLSPAPLTVPSEESTAVANTTVRKRPTKTRERVVVNVTEEVAVPTEEDSQALAAAVSPAADRDAEPNIGAGLDGAEPTEQAGQTDDDRADDDRADDQLRALLQASLDRSAAIAQVTLGDDTDYSSWSELDDLNLTDRPGDNRSGSNPFETLTLPESSLSETPLTASTTGGTVTVESPTVTAQAEEAATAASPEWSVELHAWIFHDAKSDRLFRHDQEQGRWVPIT